MFSRTNKQINKKDTTKIKKDKGMETVHYILCM